MIAQVTPDNFEVITIKPTGEMLSRVFAFEEVLNPDESVQKNLLRARTRNEITMDIDSFRNYVAKNSDSLQKRFRNPKLAQGL